jgi:hypothetical protein
LYSSPSFRGISFVEGRFGRLRVLLGIRFITHPRLPESPRRSDDPEAIALGFDEAVGADAAARFDAVSAEDRDRLASGEASRSTFVTPATASPCSFA